MSLAKLRQLQKNIETLIVSYENSDMIGPISFLECANDEIEQAIDEYKLSYESPSQEDQDED